MYGIYPIHISYDMQLVINTLNGYFLLLLYYYIGSMLRTEQS